MLYNIAMSASSAWKEVREMEFFGSFIASVIASVIANYVCKWLDKK